MAIIGTFTKQDSGFQGAIATLVVNAKVTITPVEKTSEKAPDFRIFSGKAEIGAAWSAKSKEGNAYLSVKLDDPSFAAPIVGRLVETDKGHALVWTR
ncbi:DUF736 domain-containing protein [Defluviicoccus vanus]|uniref:DUF736 domain-containing protein n=1 Tax=Defluviicoccus vanus TaxID=111831 RepID=A0A7H1MY18_9PROT|nr:DUF736 domain-containing protein [Defluviicoccus vanus]QNT68354.1 DUF736 domain-containing protein [Defluviicoccus vanus]